MSGSHAGQDIAGTYAHAQSQSGLVHRDPASWTGTLATGPRKAGSWINTLDYKSDGFKQGLSQWEKTVKRDSS